MKILFIGNVEFSKQLLLSTIQEDVEIVSVITKKKSNFNSDHLDLSEIAQKYSIDYKYVRNINHEKNVQYIKEKKPEVIFCFGWSQLLGTEILNIPQKGVYGYHPALLPKNRGRHPIIWALVLGLNETGSTFMLLDKEADTGKIASQKKVPILYGDYSITLYNRLISTAKNQVKELIRDLKNDSVKFISQRKGQGNNWRKRGKKDGEIDWRMSSRSIYNLVRALYKPYPGAHMIVNNQEIRIWEVEEVLLNPINIEPGKVLDIDTVNKTIIVKAGVNAIKIIEPDLTNLLEKGMYL